MYLEAGGPEHLPRAGKVDDFDAVENQDGHRQRFLTRHARLTRLFHKCHSTMRTDARLVVRFLVAVEPARRAHIDFLTALRGGLDRAALIRARSALVGPPLAARGAIPHDVATRAGTMNKGNSHVLIGFLQEFDFSKGSHARRRRVRRTSKRLRNELGLMPNRRSNARRKASGLAKPTDRATDSID